MKNINIMLSTINLKIGNIEYNTQQMSTVIQHAKQNKTDFLIFGNNPFVGTSIGSLIQNRDIQNRLEEAIFKITELSRECSFHIIFKSCYQNTQFIFDIHLGKVCCFESQLVQLSNSTTKYVICSDINLSQDIDCDILFYLNDNLYLYNDFVLDNITYQLPSCVAMIGNNKGESISKGLKDSTKLFIKNGQKHTRHHNQYYENSISTSIDIDNNNSKYILQQNALIPNLPQLPFVPTTTSQLDDIIFILQQATYQRLKETKQNGVVIGISGGLDSAFALVLCRSIQQIYPDFGEICAVTMHTSNTSQLSKDNSKLLIQLCKAKHIDIPIGETVSTHLKDIGHNGQKDITYQNAHARRRTSILLDLANMYGVLHIGTGDMSEIALGWSTYGGDQLAQFNPNSNLSKTMLQSLLPHLAKKLDSIEIQELVQKIVSAPISPELTPNQKTEEELGPYDLFDFILYHLIFNNESIKTTFKLCCTNFPKLSQMQIQHYMKVFIQKFYANQFKRLFGCDGIRVQKYDINALDICTSIDSSLLLNELENIKLEF